MKFTKNLVLALTLITGMTVHSPRSEAVVGIVFAPPLVTILCILGAAPLIAGGFQDGFIGRAGWIGLAGIIIADKNSNELQFNEITPSKARELGLKSSELNAYNNELERINLAVSEMSSSLAQSEKNQEAQTSALNQFKSELSEDAFSALQKISKASIAK